MTIIPIASIRDLESFVQYRWPALRLDAKISQRCSKCIEILDKDELEMEMCNKCHSYVTSHTHASDKDVAPEKIIFERAKEATIQDGEEFILGYSAGKDCTALLVKFLKRYPLSRIQCVFVNIGFVPKKALENALIATQKLGVDLLLINSSIDKFKETLRNAFLRLKDNKSQGCYGVVDFVEGSLIYRILLQTAQAKGVRLLSGMTTAQLIHIETGDTSQILFPHTWLELSHEDNLAITQEIVGGSSSTPLTTNSVLVPIMWILDILRLGDFSFVGEFSRDVRNGDAKRETWIGLFEAMEWLTLNGYLDTMLREGLKLLDLTPEDVL